MFFSTKKMGNFLKMGNFCARPPAISPIGGTRNVKSSSHGLTLTRKFDAVACESNTLSRNITMYYRTGTSFTEGIASELSIDVPLL